MFFPPCKHAYNPLLLSAVMSQVLVVQGRYWIPGGTHCQCTMKPPIHGGELGWNTWGLLAEP